MFTGGSEPGALAIQLSITTTMERTDSLTVAGTIG